MAKYKIPKDRTDADMLRAAGVNAKRTTATRSSQTQANTRATTTTDSFHRGFLTPELEERLGKLLLEVKLDYYKDEIVDFSIEARRDGRNIVLVTAPKKHQNRT
ncbi:hypothetical protein [Negativicoccus succinicivorans]|uniref:hypothetical protein n=1 Tax=Negativicoccus succinicivorans TaxID=620903 RepID=UPI00050EB2F4|nr:hypothetical protein [Negativicoccus succinicivorans]KGF12135.1 hypothetical protein HMPREF1633_02305 [Tissierellia bacterium S5-A11]MDU2929500.1 hypothetical protein [Negativicoccus succinicivorans]